MDCVRQAAAHSSALPTAAALPPRYAIILGTSQRPLTWAAPPALPPCPTWPAPPAGAREPDALKTYIQGKASSLLELTTE